MWYASAVDWREVAGSGWMAPQICHPVTHTTWPPVADATHITLPHWWATAEGIRVYTLLNTNMEQISPPEDRKPTSFAIMAKSHWKRRSASQICFVQITKALFGWAPAFLWSQQVEEKDTRWLKNKKKANQQQQRTMPEDKRLRAETCLITLRKLQKHHMTPTVVNDPSGQANTGL